MKSGRLWILRPRSMRLMRSNQPSIRRPVNGKRSIQRCHQRRWRRMSHDVSRRVGNQELPKVLYIVPWQKADPGDLTGRPVNTLLDEVLAPLDREEFTRRVDYYGDLYGEEE